jgi:hypothetical protein
MRPPATPRAVVDIQRPGLTGGQDKVRYDSWNEKGLFKSVEIELSMDESSQAKMTFYDPENRVIDAFSGYTEKAVMKVYLGYGQELGEPVFKGVLACIDRRKGETSFTCYDMAFVMKLLKKTGYKNKKDDIAIIRELVTRNKTPNGNALRFSPPEPKKLEPHSTMTQDEQTDWEHVMERAKQAGLHIYCRHDTVFARYPSDTGIRVLTVTPKDDDLLDGWEFTYHALTDRDSRPATVAHRRRGQAGKRVEGTAKGKAEIGHITAAQEYTHLNIKHDHAQPSKSKLTARAQAQRELEREHAFQWSFEKIYPADGIRPDALDMVTAKGFDKLSSGDYFVESTRFKFAPGQLSLGIDGYRDAKEDATA